MRRIYKYVKIYEIFKIKYMKYSKSKSNIIKFHLIYGCLEKYKLS